MKTTTYAAAMITLLLFAACSKDQLQHIGFNSTFDQQSTGLSIMHLKQDVAFVRLEGTIRIDEGSVRIELLNPDGNAIFSTVLQAPDEVYINRNFGATKGYWHFKYQSLGGRGKINLHLNQ